MDEMKYALVNEFSSRVNKQESARERTRGREKCEKLGEKVVVKRKSAREKPKIRPKMAFTPTYYFHGEEKTYSWADAL